jgi:MFS family permease
MSNMQRQRVKKSVAASIKDGIAWALMSGFAEPYAVPFAMALGAGTMAVGVLRAAPALASSAAQVFTEKMVCRLGSCKRALLLTVCIQALSLFASAAAVFLPLSAALPVFIAMAVVYAAAGNMSGPPWAVLMGEYIPASRRGNFFGFRSQVLGITFFAASFAASQVLGLTSGKALWGFFAVFAAAGVFRLASFYYLTLMYEPRTRFHMPRTGPGVNFLSSLDFRRGRVPALFFSVLVLLFSTYLSAPYFSVYALKELKCDYTRYMVLMTIGPLMTYLFMKRWGQAADTYGSVKILKAAFLLIPTVPLLWTFSSNFYYLTLVEMYSGIIWGAYLIGMNNFIYETIPAHSRAGYNAFYSFTGGIAQFTGALLGGWLYERLPGVWGSSFISLLFVSALLRTLSVAPLFLLVGETRRVLAAGPVELLLFMSGFKPLVR